jgi:hypothetical protein
MTNNDLQNITQKTNDRATRTPLKTRGIYRCGRPCDEVAERVWPIKISDRARTTLFNKGLVSCDVNPS